MGLNTQYRKYPPSLRNWDDVLTDENVNRLGKILAYLTELSRNHIIYPDKKDIFKVFREVSPKDVRVVILGQEPNCYGLGKGIAFDDGNNKFPILNCLLTLYPTNEDSRIVKSKSLEYLTDEGVLLLNTIMTVEKASPHSHSGIGWQQFIKDLLYQLSSKYPRIVFMLWGVGALEYRRYINEDKSLVLTYNHPSYAYKNDIKWNCDHFKRANTYLKLNNKKQVNWV